LYLRTKKCPKGVISTYPTYYYHLVICPLAAITSRSLCGMESTSLLI
jgi:hypothetical protein